MPIMAADWRRPSSNLAASLGPLLKINISLSKIRASSTEEQGPVATFQKLYKFAEATHLRSLHQIAIGLDATLVGALPANKEFNPLSG